MQAKNLPTEQTEWEAVSYDLPNLPIINEAVKALYKAVQAPYEMCLMAVLAAISTAQQSLIDVEQLHGGSIASSLWIWMLADSGERKTALMKLALHILYEQQKEYRKEYDEELKKYQHLCEIHESKKKHYKKMYRKALESEDENEIELAELFLLELEDEKPIKPVNRRFIFEDVMPEALQLRLAQGTGNAAVISSEGGTVVGGPIFRNFAFLNSTQSGDSVTVDRKSSDSFAIDDARLTFAVAIQPSANDKFMTKKGDEAIGNGFFSRCLFCYPKSNQGFREISPNKSDYFNDAKRFNDRMRELVREEDERFKSGKSDRLLVKFSDESKSLGWELSKKIEVALKLHGKYELSKPHASKLFENITRLAGNAAYFEKGKGCEISAGILNDAANICFHFSEHYLKYFQNQPEYILDATELYEYLWAQEEYGQRYVAKTPIRRSGPNRLRNMNRLNRALEYLAQRGYIVVWKIVKTSFTYIDLQPNVPDDISQWQEFCQKHNVSTQHWYELTMGGKKKELPNYESSWNRHTAFNMEAY
jgi:hypothetical protein